MAYPDPPVTPPVPQRGDRATFSARVDAFLTWVAAIIPWLQGFVANFVATLTTLAAGGANAFSYQFDSSIATGDPGAGRFRLNSVAQSSATRIFIDAFDFSNIDLSGVFNQITASTSSIKGSIRMQKVEDPSAWILYDITGFTAASGFYNFTIVYRASSVPSPFAANDSVMVFTERNGDRGDSGSAGYAKFSDTKPVGQPGGSSVVGIQDRILNTTDVNDISGASLSGNVVTLPAGSYEVEARAPGYNTGRHRIILFNVTDNSSVKYGPLITFNNEQDALLTHKFTITSPKNFKLQHQVDTAQATNGFGLGGAINPYMNIYSEIIFRKTA